MLTSSSIDLFRDRGRGRCLPVPQAAILRCNRKEVVKPMEPLHSHWAVWFRRCCKFFRKCADRRQPAWLKQSKGTSTASDLARRHSGAARRAEPGIQGYTFGMLGSCDSRRSPLCAATPGMTAEYYRTAFAIRSIEATAACALMQRALLPAAPVGELIAGHVEAALRLGQHLGVARRTPDRPRSPKPSARTPCWPSRRRGHARRISNSRRAACRPAPSPAAAAPRPAAH